MGLGKFDSPMEDAELGLPTQDESERHALDQIIRKRGYVILSRAPGREPVWSRNGIPFAQSDVIFREGLQDFRTKKGR